MTQKEIAEKLHITQASVSMALRGSSRISPALCEAVKRLARCGGYSYNLAGQMLRRGKSQIIGVFFPRATNLYYAEMYRELQRQLEPHGYLAYYVPSETEEARHKSIDKLRSFRASGVVAIGCYAENDREFLKLQQDGIPVVLEGGNPHPERPISQIVPNLYDGVKELMEYMVKGGRRRIVFLAPENMDITRRNAYEDVMAGAGLRQDIAVIKDEDYMQTGYLKTLELLDSMPDMDGIFAYNDELAIAASHAIFERGKRIPADIALAGVDNIPIGAYLSPPLTTVEQPIGKIAEAIATELLSLIQEPGKHRQISIPCKLVVRGTT